MAYCSPYDRQVNVPVHAIGIAGAILEIAIELYFYDPYPGIVTSLSLLILNEMFSALLIVNGRDDPVSGSVFLPLVVSHANGIVYHEILSVCYEIGHHFYLLNDLGYLSAGSAQTN